MKLYIKQDKSDGNQLFIIYDELCKEKYFAKGNKDKIEISDLSGDVLAKIRRHYLPTLDAYSITAHKCNIKFIMNSRSRAVNCYFYGIGWRIRGDVFTKSFDIIDADNSLVATHSKSFGTLSGGYALNIYNESKQLFCIATALCVNLQVRLDNVQMQTV